MVANSAAGNLNTITNNVVLISFNREWILRLEGMDATLRHGKRVMRKIDFLLLFMVFKHGEINYPAKMPGVLINHIKLLTKLNTHEPREFGCNLLCITRKKDSITIAQTCDLP